VGIAIGRGPGKPLANQSCRAEERCIEDGGELQQKTMAGQVRIGSCEGKLGRYIYKWIYCGYAKGCFPYKARGHKNRPCSSNLGRTSMTL
jgi:hypothetical protein